MSKAVKKTIRGWSIGLLNAVGAGALMLIAEPTSILNEPSHAARLVLGGVIISIFNYVQRSPFPSGEGDDEPNSEPIAPRASNEQEKGN
jgi:hypothetical protein